MEKLTKLNYVDLADKTMRELVESSKRDRKSFNIITTSKIRNILGMVTEIYNLVMHEPGKSINEDLQSKLRYLKMRFAYEAGRDNVVNDFIKRANILAYIDSIKDSKDDVLVFCHYVESLVAFRKYYGQILGNRDKD